MVRLVRHDAGYWTVEADGKEYSVFKTLVVAGFEYELRGCWLPESDPRVQAALSNKTLVNSRAYSRDAGGLREPADPW